MIVELRTYRVLPGRVDEFVELMRGQALPLLAEAGIDVLACGASLDDGDAAQPDAYLLRAFADRGSRDDAEAGFYTSAAWVQGPRESVLALIIEYHTVVLVLPAEAVELLRA